MISAASFFTPHASTGSERRAHLHVAEWRREHAAAQRADRVARRPRRLRLHLRITG